MTKILLNVLGMGLFVVLLLELVALSFFNLLAGNIEFALIPVVFVGFFLYVVIHRCWQMRLLALEGVETVGQVVSKSIYSRGRCRIKYAYRDPSGKQHIHASRVSRDLYTSLSVGSPIRVVFLPKRPSVSGLLCDVEICRQAVNKSRQKSDAS